MPCARCKTIASRRLRGANGRLRGEEAVAVFVVRLAAFIVVVAMVALVCYLGNEALALFTVDHVSPLALLTSTHFDPDEGAFGAGAFIAGSLCVTAFAVVLGGTLGVALGIFLAEIAPKRLVDLISPLIELLVGIPSVVYGWLGLILVVPLIRGVTKTAGFGLLAAGLVLSVMILPTVVSLSVEALRTIPRSLREGSLALGATRRETILGVLLPAARNGIAVALILGTARAIGETLAVQMVIGNATVIPHDLVHAAAALPTEIVLDMGGAPPGSPLQHALFAFAFLLLLMSMALISCARFFVRRAV